MKGVTLVAGTLAFLFSSQALSSGDGLCGFSDAECGVSALPYLEPNNDTRINLILLQSSRQHLARPLPQPLPDQARTRTDPFSAYRIMGLAANEFTATESETDDNTTPTSLVLKARKLGLSTDIQAQLDNLAPEDTEGRHISNDTTTLEAFFDVLVADTTLSAAQRITLAQARINMLSGNASPASLTQDLATLPDEGHVGALKQYLSNAMAFYQGAFAQADSGFQTLTAATQPWVAETARYMLIRVSINQAMENALDENDLFDASKVDKKEGQHALQRIDNYLQHYPKGRYVSSAQGLYRRVYWFMGDENALSQRYQQLISSPAPLDALQDLNDEIDNKLLENGTFLQTTNAPTLLLVQDIKRLRSDKGWMQLPPLTAEELLKQKPAFDAAHMYQEFRYLQAAYHYYQQRDFAAVISTIPATTDSDISDNTRFSQQVLRGLALEAEHGWQEAEAHWRHLLTLKTDYTQQQYLQLALAETLAKSGHPEAIFAAGSPVKNLRFRSAALKTVADAGLLRQQTGPQQTHEERAIALHTLLTKSLTHGDYAAYLQDSRLLTDIAPLKNAESASWNMENLAVFDWDGSDTEEGYQCPALGTVVAMLNKHPNDAHASNCLGEFFLRTANAVGFDWGEGDELDGIINAPSQFKGKAYSRMDGYLRVIADPHADADDKSYALYRAISYFAPSGNNDCGDQEINKKTRKAWFARLKSDYKGTQWAMQLKYYW